MLRRYSWYWTKVFQAVDITLIVAAWFITQGLPVSDYWVHLTSNFLPLGVLIVCWTIIARLFALYQSKRMMSLWEELKILAIVVLIFSLLIEAFVPVGLVANFRPFLFSTLVWLGVSTFHGLLRIGLHQIRIRGLNQRRVVIYGAGAVGLHMASNLLTKPQLGMKLVGFLDDKLAPQLSFVSCEGIPIPVLGTSQDIRRVISEKDIHDVFIALPFSAYARLREFILEIGDLPMNVRVVPDLFDIISVQAQSEDIWDMPVIGVRQPCIEGVDAFVKRAIDLIVSTITLLVAAPIMLLIALAIKLDSGAPILFRQERSGLNGKPFTMYKFRTMVVDAEKQLDQLIQMDQLGQPMFKIHNDPRVTRIGRILRKTSLDELPQLFNIFLGDMSLVGPRPEETRIVRMYTYDQRQRLAVKPGLTGPMQVNGRGDLSFEDRLRLEISYIKNYSLYHDFELMIQTIPVVLLGKGAH